MGRGNPDVWDKLAVQSTATRKSVADIDYLPPVVEEKKPPSTNVPRLNQARVRTRQRVTDSDRQALAELQVRGASYGYDTTMLKPKPKQSIGDMAREIHAAFDKEDEERRLWEQGFSPRGTPGEYIGGVGRGILGASRAVGETLQRRTPVDYQAIENVGRLQTDMETVRNEIISGIAEEQGQDVWDKFSTQFPTEAEQLVTDRMRDMVGVPKFTTAGTPEEQLGAAKYQLKRQLDPGIAEARIRAGSNPRTFVEIGMLPFNAAFAPQELMGGLVGAGAGHLIDEKLGGDGSKGEMYGSLFGQILGGGGRNPASSRAAITHSDDLLRLGAPRNNVGLDAVLGLDFMAKEAVEAADVVKGLSKLGLRAAMGTKERGALLLELGKLTSPIALRRTRDELASIGRAIQKSADGSPHSQRGGIGDLEPNRKARLAADKEINAAAEELLDIDAFANPDEFNAAKASYDAAFLKHRATLEELGEPNPYTDRFEAEYKALAQKTGKAEKTPDRLMEPEETAAFQEDWKAYSRSRGYTEEEIADYDEFIRMHDQGERLGYTSDELAAMDFEARNEITPLTPDEIAADPKSGQVAFDENGTRSVKAALTEEDLTDRRMTQAEWDIDEYRRPVDFDEVKYDSPTFDQLPDLGDESEYFKYLQIEESRQALDENPAAAAMEIFDRRGFPEEGLYPEQYYALFRKGGEDPVIPTGKKGNVLQRDYITWALKHRPKDFQPDRMAYKMPTGTAEHRAAMQKRNWTVRLEHTDEIPSQYSGPTKNYSGANGVEEFLSDVRLARNSRDEIAEFDAVAEGARLDRELEIDAALDAQQATEVERVAAASENVVGPSTPYTLPREFSRIASRWRSHPITWEDDFDRLLYQVSGPGKSKRAEDFRKIMDAEFGDEWRSNAVVRRALQETRQELSRLDKATPDGDEFHYAASGNWEKLKAEFDLPASPRSVASEAPVSGTTGRPQRGAPAMDAPPRRGTYEDGTFGPPRDVDAVQQSTQPGVFDQAGGKALPTERVTPSGKLTRGREEALEQIDGEFIHSANPDVPLDIGSARYLETGDIRDYTDSLGRFDEEPSQNFMLGLGDLENRSSAGLQWVDASRAADTVQNGHHGGVISRDVIWATRRAMHAKDEFSKQVRMGLHQIRLKNGFKDAPKQVFEDITSVGELVNREVARGNPLDIERLPEVQKIISKYPAGVQKQIVAYTVELRNFFDSLWLVANRARESRGDKALPYIDSYMPQIIEQNAWNRMLGKQRKSLDKDAIPEQEFMAPQVAFNPRALTRKGGIDPNDLERNAEKLAISYIDSITNDLFNTSILQNIKRHTKAMNNNALPGPAKYFDAWGAEAFGNVPTALSRTVRNNIGPLNAGLDYFMWVRRQLTRAVFPLNWSWNLFIQTSSSALTLARYGVKDSLKGMIDMFDSQKRAAVHRNAHSFRVKKGDAGNITKQDTVAEMNRVDELDRSRIDSIENAGNYLSRKIEELLTMHAVLTAKNRGEDMGLKGRSLWEFASDGGARTQSMYNKEDVVALLRTKEVGTAVPFQTFAFEVLNTVRELMPARARIPGQGRIAIGNYQTLSANQAGQNATHWNRAKHVMTWAAAAVTINEITDRAVDRKPWQLSSFLPFYSVLTAGASGYGPTNQLLFQKYTGDFYDAFKEYIKTGRWHDLRNFAIRYHVFGGSQINKTLQGIEAVAEGGVRDSTGQFKFETENENWADIARAYSQGIYATNGGKKYLEDRIDTSPVEELLGFELPGRSVEDTMNKRYREEFEDYLGIATTAEERREKGQRYSRSQTRERNPDLDARLFLAGRVSSLRSRTSRAIAQEMIIDEGLLKKADEKLLDKWRAGLSEEWVDANMDTDEYVPRGPAKQREDFVPIQETQQPTSALPTAEANWNQVSSHMDADDLRALQKVWSGEGISRLERESLQAVFQKEPMGQTNFNTWMKRTLRQLQQNTALASLV